MSMYFVILHICFLMKNLFAGQLREGIKSFVLNFQNTLVCQNIPSSGHAMAIAEIPAENNKHMSA